MDAITFQDFLKLDIRIGTVVEASVPEWSHWVMKLTVEFGTDIGQKTIFAGIMKYFKPDDVIEKQFPFIVNIEPKKIGPVESDGTQNYSQAMMLAACDPEHSEDKPVFFKLWKKVPNGTKVR